MAVAQLILVLAAVYLTIGLLFALAFAAFGAAQIDVAARGTSVAFRLLLVPGATVLWPWLAIKWMSAFRRSRIT
jgi:hypothetical protein